MKSRTVRQLKHKTKHRNAVHKLVAAEGYGPYKPVPPPKPVTRGEFSSGPPPSTSVTPPPYRMPPQPLHGEAPAIPGAAPLSNETHSAGLHTHSTKFPIERELVLSSGDKDSKIPILHEYKRRPGGAVAPDAPPKQMLAWGQESTQQMNSSQYTNEISYNRAQDNSYAVNYPGGSSATGAVPRTYPQQITEVPRSSRIPPKEEATNDVKEPKKTVSKTYHTLKDMLSRFKSKDQEENKDDPGLNNVADELRKSLRDRNQDLEQQNYGYQLQSQYMRYNTETLNQSQPNILAPLRPSQDLPPRPHSQMLEGAHRALPMPPDRGYARPNSRYVPPEPPRQETRSPQQIARESLRQKCFLESRRAASQPQLAGDEINIDRPPNLPNMQQRRGSHGNIIEVAIPIDEKDSDDGGFRDRPGSTRILDQNYNQSTPNITSQNQNKPQSQQMYQQNLQNVDSYIQTSSITQAYGQNPHVMKPAGQGYGQTVDNYNQNHQSVQNYSHNNSNIPALSQSVTKSEPYNQNQSHVAQNTPKVEFDRNSANVKTNGAQSFAQKSESYNTQKLDTDAYIQVQKTATNDSSRKQISNSAASSDYDKNGGQSSNVDSGRGSAAYSSGRKEQKSAQALDTSTESSDATQNAAAGNFNDLRNQGNDTEWVDIVDSELRHILEPQLHGLTLRGAGAAGGSTLSGSVSSVTPPLPPLSPGGSTPRHSGRYKAAATFPYGTKPGLEYGLDSYNRGGRSQGGPLGPSRAGWPGSTVQKHQRTTTKKDQHQGNVKRHLFGLDNDVTSTTTRSLDLESMLGGRSPTDSEADTEGLRDIRSQLEGLENMYSEVLRMLGVRRGIPGGTPGSNRYFNERGGPKRRHGSVSSLPSSSVSSRPLRDRRRSEERKKVKDIRGINKRFQRLESHVVTLARSVAHLSSEMRTQHLVMQEMEGIRGDIAALRSQATRGAPLRGSNNVPEPPNLTNPNRVKKLTKFFGEDPPLMRLFLKKLGYEKYAPLFENERVGMVELPYLGEERLQRLGVPLGPRLRILQEAQISLCLSIVI